MPATGKDHSIQYSEGRKLFCLCCCFAFTDDGAGVSGVAIVVASVLQLLFLLLFLLLMLLAAVAIILDLSDVM